MLILKLGGAAITDKDTSNTPNRQAIKNIARVISEFPQKLILVHGAGSYGHILAKEYALQTGFHDPRQIKGLIQLPLDLLDLNRLLIEAFHQAGISAMTFHPASMCYTEQGRITQIFLDPIRRALALGIIPVLYGDCVWDEEQTFCILSGDQMMVRLANELNASRVAFGTNVDGVLDAEGKVIPQYSFRDSHPVGQSASTDVTGGMAGKLREIQELQSASAQIFNLNNLDQLRAILAHQDNVGTFIKV